MSDVLPRLGCEHRGHSSRKRTRTLSATRTIDGRMVAKKTSRRFSRSALTVLCDDGCYERVRNGQGEIITRTQPLYQMQLTGGTGNRAILTMDGLALRVQVVSRPMFIQCIGT